MGELVSLADYRERKLQEDIDDLRDELAWLVHEWLEVGSIIASSVPFLEEVENLTEPIEILIER